MKSIIFLKQLYIHIFLILTLEYENAQNVDTINIQHYIFKKPKYKINECIAWNLDKLIQKCKTEVQKDNLKYHYLCLIKKFSDTLCYVYIYPTTNEVFYYNQDLQGIFELSGYKIYCIGENPNNFSDIFVSTQDSIETNHHYLKELNNETNNTDKLIFYIHPPVEVIYELTMNNIQYKIIIYPCLCLDCIKNKRKLKKLNVNQMTLKFLSNIEIRK